uniref:Uncharacterized protein n=1 Tax=Arundo donax TaxID=35708 RepID=A0A0A9GN53_ARUDO
MLPWKCSKPEEATGSPSWCIKGSELAKGLDEGNNIQSQVTIKEDIAKTEGMQSYVQDYGKNSLSF